MKIELNKSLETERQEDGTCSIPFDEQMSEYYKRNEKIKQLKKDFMLNPGCDIIEDKGEFYVIDAGGYEWRINVELREELPNSFFLPLKFDSGIIGYDHKTGAIIYNLWLIGKIEMILLGEMNSDFHDTGYGIGKLLRYHQHFDFDDLVPPINILTSDFINSHQTLQASIYAEGMYNISLVNDVDVKEHQRLVLLDIIESKKKSFKEFGHTWTEEQLNRHNEKMERLEKKYQEFLEAGKSDLYI